MHDERETRKDSIHLVDSFNSPRTKRTQYYHFDQSVKQILLLGDRFIQPKNNHGGVLKQRVAYSEIRSICHDDPNKSIILVLSPSDTRHSPSKLTLLSTESYPITLHNASALSYLADSIANIYATLPDQLINELAQSANFIENLDQFLQYIQIPCPQISKILELHCTQPSKTPLSEQVIRHTVTKAMTHTSLENMIRSEEIKACSRLTCVYLNQVTGGRLPFYDPGQPFPNEQFGKTSHDHTRCNSEIISFVHNLHGQDVCSPHLLTLNNIKKIAKMAIIQCYQTSEQGLDCCLTYPSGVCYYAKRFEWAKLGIDLLLYASDFEDWRHKLSETILPSFLPEPTRTCKQFGDLLPPLLVKLIQHGNPMKLSGLLPHARPDAITWLSLSSTQCQSTSTCLTSTVQSKIFKEFLTIFNQASPQPSPTVLKNLAERYFKDILSLSYRNFQPAVDILVRCHNQRLISSQKHLTQTDNYMRSSNKHEAHARRQLLLSAPGGKKSKCFQSSTTDSDVQAYLSTERGGELEDLDLSSTDITDNALIEIMKLPKLKILNLMTTRITDEGLLTISLMPELTNLNLSECEFITPVGIRHLARLQKLTTLYANSTNCNDEVIQELKTSIPNLINLDLRYTEASICPSIGNHRC